MKTYLDCVPCFVRQALDAVRLVSSDEAMAERVLRYVLVAAARMRMDMPPPFMGREIHRIIRKELASPDPYAELKRQSTQVALKLIEGLEKQLQESPRPFELAVRFAIAGNVMDFALASQWDGNRIEASLEEAVAKSLDSEAVEKLREATVSAKSILYIGDNAGETVFDRLLIRCLPEGSVHYAVKSYPVINDSTRVDAEASGISEMATIIENGNDAPGTILGLCSEAFCRHFEEADVVIAKGQANYETLSGEKREIFFLTQVKCAPIARDLGRAIGDWAVICKPPMVSSEVGCVQDLASP